MNPTAETHIALLRGVNVGGNNKVPMADLRAIFERAGAGNVRTYIQSGNVVFEAAAAATAKIATVVSARIAKDLGCKVPLVLRSAKELRIVVAKNPFLARGESEDACYVMFLADKPSAVRIASLDTSRSPGDELAVRGRDIYLFLPNGGGKSKLTNAWFDSKLATTSTARNWRTVQKLIELAGR